MEVCDTHNKEEYRFNSEYLPDYFVRIFTRYS